MTTHAPVQHPCEREQQMHAKLCILEFNGDNREMGTSYKQQAAAAAVMRTVLNCQGVENGDVATRSGSDAEYTALP